MATRRRNRSTPVVELSEQPDWYKDAVIYELHVRAFADSNGDGVGDFPGLTSKLDYLASLGITAIWLLPFYPSPLRDDGYDIADYTTINPTYGTLRDFRRFLDEAHKRGLRVITELVMNHTSDQHPWFQRARKAPPNSRWRNWYVWSDTPDRWPEARVIFEDFETSNWSWDPVAGAYYWHRFFHHQPDLNFDNPEVRAAMLRIVDFWFEMGVDGMRLDAVPYLFERDGTNCENLPETHRYLKELRAHIDERFPNRMLLAEANQWPEDAVAYFGDPVIGDECHMAFHFPLMPRLYMALRMEDRHPVIDILSETPPIPENCQWALFLRNHDELTLEMVTDEERDYMYRAYAHDPQARVNLGIRRRLAPLLGNDRRKVELLNGLLFSLPGTPVVYYGDELGMGDNFYLGDRDAVRTPMQWSPDRNAGFSAANPQQLYLPVIIDPEYHYETVNVEAQHRNPNSLLWWMRRLIALRHRHPVLGRGRIEFLYPENAKVLAFLRGDEHERVLVVANLSRFAQSVTLDLHDYRGAVLWELFGSTEFGYVTEGHYHLTLGPYGFYWFAIVAQTADRPGLSATGSDLPILRVRSDWRDIVRGQARGGLERALPRFFNQTRWFAGKARTIREVTIADAISVPSGTGRTESFLLLVNVDYVEGEPETYVLPLLVAAESRIDEILGDHPQAAIAWLEIGESGERLLVYDAAVDASFAQAALTACRNRRTFKSDAGAVLRWSSNNRLRRVLAGTTTADLPVTLSAAEQSNSTVIFGNKVLIKMFRRAQEGVNPDLEIGEFLAEHSHFEHTAPLLGALQYQLGKEEPRTLAVVNGYVPNEGDAWHYTLDALGLFYENALALLPDDDQVAPGWHEMMYRLGERPPDPVAEAIGPYLDSAELLGRRTAELHEALLSDDIEAFAPEPFTTLWQRSLYQAFRAQVGPTLQLLRRSIDRLPEEARENASFLLDAESEILAIFQRVRDHRIDAMRSRVHGDYHLGQVLHAGRDFVIIDFEGEPSRSPTERRIKRSPLSDVAGMVRSFQYAARAGFNAYEERGLVTAETRDALLDRGELWNAWVTLRFLTGYFEAIASTGLVPASAEDRSALLSAYVLDKALYEVRYELNNRPDWAPIPIEGVVQIIEAGRARA